MKRCQKCIMPETLPGIQFNENGICNHSEVLRGYADFVGHFQRYYWPGWPDRTTGVLANHVLVVPARAVRFGDRGDPGAR